MYLPFILLRQFGWPGLLAFAIPNVLGCAAFGYLLTPARQVFIRERCGPLCFWFSIATVAFQSFFAGWMLAPPAAFAVVAVGVLCGIFLRDRGWLRLSLLVACGSGAFVFMGEMTSVTQLPATGSNPPASLFGLAPAIALGFLACPYLDLTFHRALERSPSRHAFAVFGVAFALTLVGVVSFWNPENGAPRIGVALALLWTLQLAFTIGAHVREGWEAQGSGGFAGSRCSRLAVCWGLLIGLALGWMSRFGEVEWIGGAEGVYLRILVLYGLVFPYLLLFRLRGVPTWLSAAAVVASLPFFELGFMRNETEMLFLPMTLLCVLLMASFDKRLWKSTRPT